MKEPYGSILLRYFLQEADQLANENATKCKVKDLSQVHICSNVDITDLPALQILTDMYTSFKGCTFLKGL